MIKQLVSLVKTAVIRTAAIAATVTVAGGLLTGCASHRHPNVPVGPIPVGGFSQAWQAPLNIGKNNSVAHLYLTESGLYVYTTNNLVYCLAPSGGQILWVQQIGQSGDEMMPPTQIKGATVIAVNSTLWIIGPDGRVTNKIATGHNIRSPLAAVGSVVYCGVDYANGGRLAKIDLVAPYNNTRWELLTGRGISAAPVAYQAAIYAGGEDGNVYAVNEDRSGIWPLEGSYFHTDGPIIAGLRADDFGLYVASMDTKLYCLDRSTGKIRWEYFSGHALDRAPQITADTVYQAISGIGVAAIDKTNGGQVRTPRWLVRDATRFLGEDAENVYLRGTGNNIMGVDKQTGKPTLHSTRNDLTDFVSNPKGGTLFAATDDGLVMAINPVTQSGTVGQVVRASTIFQTIASAR